jgi:paired amphipathic helix protein Sin3a
MSVQHSISCLLGKRAWFQVLYSRLALFKGLAAELASAPPNLTKSNATTAEPGPSLSDQAGSVAHTEYYELLLDSCERLFDNDLEQHAFEDQIRSIFGIKVR